MIKYLVLLLNFGIIMFMNTFFQTNVQTDISVPQTVNAGESFEVRITVDKGDLASFSRYMQKLPAGLKAIPSNSANADFTFKDQKLRLIWLKLPASQSVVFTYNVQVDKRLKGEFNIDGLFSYIENNERKSAGIKSNPITIIPSPDLSPSQIVDIQEFERAIIPDLTPSRELDVACIRQKPDVSDLADGIVVNLIVNKGNQEQYAKIEENIPDGFTAVPIETKDAIFTFKNQVAKYLWMNLPAESFFNVSYKLIPNPGVTADEINVSGMFSYMDQEKEQTYTVDIREETYQLANNTEAEIKKTITNILTGQHTPPSPTSTSLLASAEKKGVSTTQPTPPSLQGKTSKTPSLSKPSSRKYGSENAATSKSDLLQPESGIYYRVQVAAGHKAVNIGRYFKQYKLEKNVKKEFHQGWHKYSVGSFGLYKEARDYRNYIWKTTEIDDAFVAAYNSGERITVQEALMIANQKWYK